jgi:hypothetical protein
MMARVLFQLLALQLVLVVAVLGLFAKKLPDGTKYQLQQKVLTLGSSYIIKDDKDKPVYKVNIHLLLYQNFY